MGPQFSVSDFSLWFMWISITNTAMPVSAPDGLHYTCLNKFLGLRTAIKLLKMSYLTNKVEKKGWVFLFVCFISHNLG